MIHIHTFPPAWIRSYRSGYLPGDLIAGFIVATVLVPQAMAYALLAGLPPVTGLYASILPVLIYAFLGSSNYLAMGPVALVCLMVADVGARFALPGTPEFQAIVLVQALLCGVILVIFALLRFGALVNFLSHSVITGLINAAAVLIAVSQLPYLLGLELPRTDFADTLSMVLSKLAMTNGATAIISLLAIVVLLVTGKPVEKGLVALGCNATAASVISRSGPLLVVLISALLVYFTALHAAHGVAIVGSIPAGLPPLSLPAWDPGLWYRLLPGALLIALVSYLGSISVARSLASRRRERVNANLELLAVGAANIGAALSSGFPVGGGFGRSSVNFSAGANTPLASIITAALVLLTLLVLSPLFYYLPKAVLAAIVFTSVIGLMDIRSVIKAWSYNKADALSSLLTFVAVLEFGVEQGVLTGVIISISLYMWRTSRPHMAVVGRVGHTEHFRNILRHQVQTCPHVLAIRIDESLYFANAHALEDRLLALTSGHREIRHVLLICSAINYIDYNALETLEATLEKLRNSGVTLHLAEVKGPVMDKLKHTAFMRRLLEAGKVYLSTHEAMVDLECV